MTSWLLANRLRPGLALAALIVLATLAYSWNEARSVRVVHDELRSPRVGPGLEGTRLVFVSDVHAGPFLGEERMRALVETVNDLRADVLVLGGDYVGGRRGGAEIFYRHASEFRARAAKVAVLGNHDAWEGRSDAEEGLATAGFTLLANRNATIAIGTGTLAVAGVDDLYTGRPDPVAAADGIGEEDFAVLVSHNPDVFADQLGATTGRWDLALAGHTHAGQITFFGVRAPFVPSRHGERYRSGWITESGTPILVSNGVGSVTLPLRLFARPEVHVITLRGE